MISPAVDPRLLGLVASVLVGSPFEHRARWPHAVVLLRREERRVTSRGDLSQFFATNDLPQLARECMARRVPPGCILVWLEADTDEVAAAGFVVFDLASAFHEVRS